MSSDGAKKPRIGRPPGAVNKRTRAVAERIAKAAEAGLVMAPVEVLMENMAWARQQALDLEAVLRALAERDLEEESDPEMRFKRMLARIKPVAELRQLASDNASAAAPYIHPRLSAVTVTTTVKTHEQQLDELERIMNGELPVPTHGGDEEAVQ